LLKLPNPFRDVIVFDPGKLAYPDPHREALRAVGHLHGRRGIVGTFPASQKTLIEGGLIKAVATWWNPVAIWEHWSECLTKSLHSLVEHDDAHGSAAAYSLAMKAEAAPETGNSCNQLHDQPV
jgi:hypothetical protein